VVGFYLNSHWLRDTHVETWRGRATNAQEIIETLGTKIGLVLLVLGAMHFFNLFVFTQLR
jgi:hypothetical protein